MKLVLFVFSLGVSSMINAQCEELANELLGTYKIHPNPEKMEASMAPEFIASCETLELIKDVRQDKKTTILEMDNYILEIFPKEELVLKSKSLLK
jgi:hypothetical protein